MLPYRLRPPSYGAKLKEQKESSSSSSSESSFLDRTQPYREGGPLERAIKADLAALLPKFEHALIARTADDEQPQQQQPPDGGGGGEIRKTTHHLPPGTAFGAFKQVFGEAKVAMLHRSSTPSSHATTGFRPPRCDRNAYSQLLYAVCFSLLRDAFHPTTTARTTTTSNERTVLLSQAAYAVFSLYALYETNPLPRAPNTKEGILALLPMGLQNRDNPKALYRRAFRQAVRIDIEHYAYLLRLRDLARAAQASCQQRQWCHAATAVRISGKDDSWATTTTTDDGAITAATTAAAATWKCDCAVATDVGVVLDRILLSNNMLEFCAYTGPCGLEGLAGHADYPFPATEGATTVTTTAANVTNNNESASTTTQQALGETAIPASEEPFSSELEERVAAYLSSRQAIRLPAVKPNMAQKEKRIREILLPIFSQQNEEHGSPIHDDPLSTLLTACRGKQDDDREQPPQKRIKLRHRHVTFGTVLVKNDANTMGMPADKPTKEGMDGESMSFMREAVTDNGGPATDPRPPPFELILPSSLSPEQHSSLQDAVQALLDRDESLLLPLQGGGSSQVAAPSHIEGLTNDDGVSTLGDGIVSTASTTIADAGRGALRDLLSRVKAPMTSAGESMSTGQFFLASGAAEKHDNSALPTGDKDDTRLSDLSSDDENDEVSVAASRVGQRALQKLLSTAADGKPNACTKPKSVLRSKKKAPAPAQKARKSTTDVSDASASCQVETGNRNEDSDNDSEYYSSAVSSTIEAANQGRDALNALLSRAHRTNGRNTSV